MNESVVIFFSFLLLLLFAIYFLHKKVRNFINSYISNIENDIQKSDNILKDAKQELRKCQDNVDNINSEIERIKSHFFKEMDIMFIKNEKDLQESLNLQAKIMDDEMKVAYNDILMTLKKEILHYVRKEIINKISNNQNIEEDITEIIDSKLSSSMLNDLLNKK